MADYDPKMDDLQEDKAEDEVCFAFDVSVYVTMRGGRVVSVHVDDSGPLDNNARLIDGGGGEYREPADKLKEIIARAEACDYWPAWRFGW